MVRDRSSRAVLGAVFASVVLIGACAPAAPSPTAAPAKPAEAAKPAATAAPAAKPAEAKPAASPVAKPAEAKPAASPAAKPAEDKPAASPAAKPALSKAEGATFDEKAVADFYRGKTVKFIVGFDPGGAYDAYSRLLARHMLRLLPGNPTVIAENRPGAASRLAANTVYRTEPKDGTIIASINQNLVMQQVMDPTGIEFDAAKFHWLGSSVSSPGGCAARVDTGVTSIRDVIDSGKELVVAADAPGSNAYDIPAVLSATLGAKFKIVPGYTGIARMQLAVQNKEADAYCFTDPLSGVLATTLQSNPPIAKVIVVLGSQPFDDPILRGAPPAETLAKTDEARQLLRAVQAPLRMSFPFAVAPEVPADRVAALRKVLKDAFVDPQFVAEAKQANLTLSFSDGESVQRIVQEVLNTPKPVLDKLKELLKP
jgi:tripartite-type tricarboxylate transporter receptor subunit TctC